MFCAFKCPSNNIPGKRFETHELQVEHFFPALIHLSFGTPIQPTYRYSRAMPLYADKSAISCYSHRIGRY